MLRRTTILILLVALITNACQQKIYQRTENGIIVNAIEDTVGESVKLEVFSDNIIRVVVSPDQLIKNKESLIVTENHKEVKWSVLESKETITLKTDSLKAEVSLLTGKVTFKDNNGNLLLKESESSSRKFDSITISGEKKYRVRQVFDSPDDEAFYGLGQHQHGQVNYKGEDVELAQHNLVAVVPFLYSSKNYGILWDNYSITRFGDPREYKQINELRLYDKKGESGALTATYYQPGRANIVKRESVIDYQNLDEAGEMPDITEKSSKIVWEGYLVSGDNGLHKFLLYGSEYFTLYINDELIMNKWRQGWNPWSNKFKIDMKAGEKYKIRLEWRPMGSAYLSLKCLSPMDSEEQQKLSLYSEVADYIDYYFVKGNNADEVISGYRTLTGKSPIMPKWAMGLWQSRERYKTQDELVNVVKEYRKRKIPLDNIVLDWRYWPDPDWGTHEFDSARFPDPVGMNKTLHEELNTRIMISIWPKFNTKTDHFDEMNEKGYLYPRLLTKNLVDWVGYYSTFYDAFNPGARDLFWKQINEELYTKGFDAWWLDATEPDMHSNFSVEERKLLMNPTYLGSGAEYFNAFSLMNTKGVFEGQMKENPNIRPFILTRSAFAGQQKYSAATWSGDVVTRWSDLKDQIAAGINFSLSGIPYWTTDIGGFSVEKRYENKDPRHLQEWREINLRWYQFGVFCPLFRIHGQFPFREIYNISSENSEVYKSMVYYDELRYRLMPYIYSLAAKTYYDDYTIMRGLVMDHGADTKTLEIDDQYMFGPSLLINPVYEFKATEREVYLPSTAGWYDVYSGNYYKGGQTITADAPLPKIPVYAPEGSILIFGPEIQYTMQKKADTITVFVYAGKNASFNIYEDQGLNNNYKEGEYCMIPLNYSEKNKTLVFGKCQGDYPGMLNEIIMNVCYVTPEKSCSIDDLQSISYSIKYTGNEQTILLH